MILAAVLYLVPVLHGLSFLGEIDEELKLEYVGQPLRDYQIAYIFQLTQIALWPIFMLLDAFIGDKE